MAGYDKLEVREKLEIEDIYSLLLEFGGEPEYSSFGIISFKRTGTSEVTILSSFISVVFLSLLNDLIKSL